MAPKKGPTTTKNQPQEASKCLLERMCGFQARSNSILSDLGLQHGLNMGSKIAQKTLKNRLGRPKAAEKPQGTYFDSKLSPFWTILGTKNASKSAQIDFVALGPSRRLKESISGPTCLFLRQGTSQEKPSEPQAHENSVEIAGQKSFGHRCRPVLAKPLAQWPVVGALAPLEIRPLSL